MKLSRVLLAEHVAQKNTQKVLCLKFLKGREHWQI
jgi:hypothetical protein